MQREPATGSAPVVVGGVGHGQVGGVVVGVFWGGGITGQEPL